MYLYPSVGTAEEFEDWSAWSECDPLCGNGKRKRERVCKERITGTNKDDETDEVNTMTM